MTSIWMQVRCRLKLVSSLVMGGALIAFSSNCVLAQNITLDGSLGLARTLTGPDYVIPQAAGQTVGSNLFHSFGRFGLNTGEAAIFQSTANIRNILSRVTGGSPSLIDGLIYTPSSNVNLFLINPSGIVFGPNARLDVGGTTRGSFVATTVDALVWPNGGQFSATNPGGSGSLLTLVGDPSGFLSLQRPPQPIVVRALSQDFSVYQGQSLLLLGGDVSLDGGNLLASGGRIELGGVAGAGTVGLNVDGNNLSLSFPDDVTRAEVSVTNGAVIGVLAEDGGSIAINARNLNISGESVLAAGIGANLGSIGSQAGDITLNATGTITIANSFVFNDVGTGGVGNGGNININARSLSITDDAQLSASIFGQGNSGSIFLQADDSVSLARDSAIFNQVQAGGVGNSGDINITAGSLSLTDGAQLQAFVAYDMEEPRTLPSGRGDAGDVNINVRDSVTLVGKGGDSGTGITAIWNGVGIGAVGNGGDINIRARTLSLTNAQLGADTSGQGDAGDIFIRVVDSIYLTNSDNVLVGNRRSRIGSAVTSKAEGNGGNVDIQSRSLFLDNGAMLDASTQGKGNGGNITVSTNTLAATNGGQIFTSSSPKSERAGTISLNVTDSVTLSGSDPNFAQRRFSNPVITPNSPASGVFAQTQGAGDAGNLRIETDKLIVRDGAAITVSSTGSGIAGSLIVETDSIRLDNKATISANTSGGGGNINLRTDDLILRRGSSITTNATGSNIPGGNITIDTDNLVAVPKESSDISANSEESFGGRVIINAQGIFGTQFRPRPTDESSDITASSELGPQFNGIVQLNTPDIDLNRGFANLPTEVVDVSNQIDQTCGAGGREARKNEFIVTGRRGMPSNPYEPLSDDEALADVRPPSGFSSRRNSQPVAARTVSPQSATGNQQPPIVEAQGWVINDKGQVVLTATASTATPHNSLPASATCPSS